MYTSTRNKLPNTFTSYFTTVKMIHTRTRRLTSSEFNLYLQYHDIDRINCKIGLNFRGSEFGTTRYLINIKNWILINLNKNTKNFCYQNMTEKKSRVESDLKNLKIGIQSFSS